MPANINAIYTRQGLLGSVLVTAANTSSQGGGTIGTDIFLAATCDADNGSFIQRVRLFPVATTPTTMTATTGRVFISSVATGGTTSADTWIWQEASLPAWTADSATAGSNFIDIPFGFVVPAGKTILVSTHAAPAANSAWRAIVVGGDY